MQLFHQAPGGGVNVGVGKGVSVTERMSIALSQL